MQQVTWHAHWIWTEHPAGERNETIYARRVIALDGEVSAALLHISADTFYRLYVNGKRVGHGPARSDPAWMSYDTYDVADLLWPGENGIAVEANSIIRSPGGLICQCTISAGGREIVVATDATWRVLAATAWDRRALQNTPWDYSELYDARREPEGWCGAGFDDSEWQTPALRDDQDTAKRRVAVATDLPGHTHTEPYLMLEPRDIPMMIEEVALPTRIVDQGEAEEVLSSDQVVDIALEMAIEPLSPLRFCRIDGTERLLKETGLPVVVANEFPYSSPETEPAGRYNSKSVRFCDEFMMTW